MKQKEKKTDTYEGFEQGPIRPPSEAASLLIRITRNCPWNRCTFCPIYKQQTLSLRPVDHVLKDIDAIARHLYDIQYLMEKSGPVSREAMNNLAAKVDKEEWMAFYAAQNWINAGMHSIFLQDANSLIIKPDRLLQILEHLKQRFPWVERITSYARSHTIFRISDSNLRQFAASGLNRIHIGMESGSDKVLALIRKGVDKETQIRAGLKVKKAGMELSEYVMPGLGGKEFSSDHALETADALNQINADFIRLRTLAIPNHVELYKNFISGAFDKLGDRAMAEELLLFLESLGGITSTLKSDHILNLFEEVEGTFPEDKQRMTKVIRRFLAMKSEEQIIYQVGRRTGLFSRLDQLAEPDMRRRAEKTCAKLHVTPENVDSIVDEMTKRFI
jgi:hypothetical protein